jgi:uridine kinase
LLDKNKGEAQNMGVMNKPMLIIIAGPSASGKTHLIEWLYHRHPGYMSIVSADNYYHKQDHIPLHERLLQNYDHPDAIEWGLLEKHLLQLLQKNTIQSPKYCFVKCTRTNNTLTIKPKPIILLDGLLCLAKPNIRQHANLSLYIDTPLDICLTRRIKRDVAVRGRTSEQVIQQYLSKTRPMYYEHILPSRQHADLIIPSTEHIEKVCVLLEQHLVGYIHQE